MDPTSFNEEYDLKYLKECLDKLKYSRASHTEELLERYSEEKYIPINVVNGKTRIRISLSDNVIPNSAPIGVYAFYKMSMREVQDFEYTSEFI